ncbi:MAG: toprim domain-containing protein, partial [Chloroflexota bacterium]
MAVDSTPAAGEPAKRTRAKRAPTAGSGDLVVVESPTKARTLERMLGAGYKVEASFGHIRDLPKSKLGIDPVTFLPDYIVPDDSEKTARLLRKEAKAAARIWLAT